MRTIDSNPIDHDAVTVAGLRRTFTVLGSRSAPHPRPLVLVFHGSRQTADAHRRFTGDALAGLATDGDAVVAYLDGYRGHWNDARRGSTFAARRRNIDDVAFSRAVVGHLATTHGIDPDRVLTVGYSNGGQMVLRLLHDAPDIVAAAIIIAATMPAPDNLLVSDPAAPARPTPVTLVHGTRDRIAPFAGGTIGRWARAVFQVGGRMRSAPDTAAYLAGRNGIATDPVTQPVPPRLDPARTNVVRTTYQRADAPPVTLYEVRGGGHTIPGPHPAPRLLGRTSADVALADLVQDALAELRVRGR